MGAYVYNNDGTCQKNGTQTRTCVYNCGKAETVTKPDSATHTNIVTVLSAAASHTDIGYNTHTECVDCGTKFGYEEYPALECDFRLKSYKKPTCTESGLIVYECTLGCGRRQEETVAPRGHVYEVKDGVAPTCKAPGHAAYAKCKQCGHTEESPEVIPTLPHDFSVVSHVKEPTCNAEGYTLYKCKWCSETQKRDFKEKLSHNMDEGTLISALCGSKAEYKVKCKNCKYYYTESRGDVIEHNYIRKETKNATCTASGYVEYQCSVCSKPKYDKLAETGHNYNGKEEYIIEPGCESSGEKRVYCSNTDCKSYKTVTVNALGHDLVSYSQGVAATCTTDGWTAGKKCSRCDYTENATIIPKKGHTIGNETVLVAPTCNESGSSEYKACTRCGYYENGPEYIPALRHNIQVTKEFKQATCTENGNNTEVSCTNPGCDFKYGGEIIEKINHDKNAYTLSFRYIGGATCKTYDKAEFFCNSCNYSEIREVPEWGYGGHDTMNSNTFKYISDEGCKAVCTTCNQPEGELLAHTPKTNSAGQPMAVSSYYHKGTYGNYTYHINYECALCGEVYAATVDKSEIDFDYEECNHICHKTGFMGIFAKIAIFFWKLFKSNPVCECGMEHY